MPKALFFEESLSFANTRKSPKDAMSFKCGGSTLGKKEKQKVRIDLPTDLVCLSWAEYDKDWLSEL